jgi:hypothetical protein
MNRIIRALLKAKFDIENNHIGYILSDERSREIFMSGFENALIVVIEELKKEDENEQK